jgi:cyclophilin family peptidyl-prolyl cis-trans isomerase
VRLDMSRFSLLSVFITFTALLAAVPPPYDAQNQNPRALGTPAPQAVAPLTPEARSRALHDPHDSLWSQPAPVRYRVRIETTKGIIVLEVARALAPRGADRFYHLVQVGFYDNSRFFRVISGRFAQFGISGDPVIAKIWQNERVLDDPVKDSNVRGRFAFAMTGPDARRTQIYINTGDQPRLDAMGFAPFGKVVEGMSVVDKLYAGYGETSGGGMRAGHQGKLFEEGNAYLDREFPFLDRLVRAEIIEEQK